MGKIAFVFSGQGDQYAGMGKELKDKYPSALNVFETLDSIRPNTSTQCFEGSDEELKQTKNTQPCLFAMEMAGATVLKEAGIIPSAVAGFSLGEVVALTFAGSVSLEDGFKIVCKRGEIMQQEAEKYETSMVAVVKLSAEIVKELAQQYSEVYPVNFNCPGQISVAGSCEQIVKFSEDVKNAGGRALPIRVKGAFHSPYMKTASSEFAEYTSGVEFKKPEIALYSNLTSKPYGDNIHELLSNQICNPVLWEYTIRNMIDAGIDTFIEIGPAKTLSNMIAKISSEVKTYSISNIEQILLEVKND
ncbi:MAG: ACP S-malonyltransferase [Clostridia bacterium]|nr:ACP S-malonyltransferase [Clostridia bacterium]